MGALDRPAVEDFLFEEAAMLDDWRLVDWLGLFTDDARYLVPSVDSPPDAQPDTTLFYIADNRHRLEQRVVRLGKRTAHAEYPHSKTRRVIANVRIRGRDGEVTVVTCNFVTFRTKNGVTDTFMGHHEYRLVETGQGLKIREKRTVLDLDALSPQGKVSIIV